MSAGAIIRFGVDPRATDPRGAPRRVANIALGGKARSAKGATMNGDLEALLREAGERVAANDGAGAIATF